MEGFSNHPIAVFDGQGEEKEEKWEEPEEPVEETPSPEEDEGMEFCMDEDEGDLRLTSQHGP